MLLDASDADRDGSQKIVCQEEHEEDHTSSRFSKLEMVPKSGSSNWTIGYHTRSSDSTPTCYAPRNLLRESTTGVLNAQLIDEGCEAAYQ